MICGNDQAKNVMKTIFDKIDQNGQVQFNFLLLDGPKHIGKTSLVKRLSRDLLKEYYNNNFLYIPDLSEKDGHPHRLKVDVKEKNRIKEVDWEKYHNMGARQIINWLNKSSIGNIKIVYIENIERMTRSAGNAMLKTFEEPSDDKLIIASTSNSKLLLDTIVSRGYVINFKAPSSQKISNYIQNRYPKVDKEKIKTLISFFKWKIGLVIDFIENDKKISEGVIDKFNEFIKLDKKSNSLNDKISLLKKIDDDGQLETFLQALVYRYSQENKVEKIQKVFQAQRHIENNVSVENALFNMII